MVTTIDYGAIEIIGAVGRQMVIKITDLDVPISSGSDEDLIALGVGLPEWIDTQGAKKVTIYMDNNHATLDAVVTWYSSGMEDPLLAHTLSDWVVESWDPGTSDSETATHAEMQKKTFDGPLRLIKPRGKSSGAAFTAGFDVYIVLTW